jgi:hypothetical protein
MNLWQLKNIKTGEALNEPQLLPENWGPIFGLQGVIDKIGDLSWLGEAYADMGWVIVGDAPPAPATSTEADLAWERAKQLLRESDWSMLSDVPMTSGQKSSWIEYRRALREVRLQSGFPNNIQWPKQPS